jgi:hypothetical protein
MLVVVLLSAAPTGSQVQVRSIGSAFDPATVSVAVSPKKLKIETPSKKGCQDNRCETVVEFVEAAGQAATLLTSLGVIAYSRAVAKGDFGFSLSHQLPAPVSLLARSYAPRAPPLL